MNNAFGHIPEDLLQQAQEAWDFKTCQRSDGTTYGTAGDCAQKGSKEVKKSSKKSSWDPGTNLAGKLGTERAKTAGTITSGLLKGFDTDSYKRTTAVMAKVSELFAAGKMNEGQALLKAHSDGHTANVQGKVAETKAQMGLANASKPAPLSPGSKPSSAPTPTPTPAPKPAPTSSTASGTKSVSSNAQKYVTKTGPSLKELEKQHKRAGWGSDAVPAAAGLYSAMRSADFATARNKAKDAGDLKAAAKLAKAGIDAANKALAEFDKVKGNTSAVSQYRSQVKTEISNHKREAKKIEAKLNPPKAAPQQSGSGSSGGGKPATVQDIKEAFGAIMNTPAMQLLAESNRITKPVKYRPGYTGQPFGRAPNGSDAFAYDGGGGRVDIRDIRGNYVRSMSMQQYMQQKSANIDRGQAYFR